MAVGSRLPRQSEEAAMDRALVPSSGASVCLSVCNGFFIDNTSMNNLVQCAMCASESALRRSEGMMLNMST